MRFSKFWKKKQVSQKTNKKIEGNEKEPHVLPLPFVDSFEDVHKSASLKNPFIKPSFCKILGGNRPRWNEHSTWKRTGRVPKWNWSFPTINFQWLHWEGISPHNFVCLPVLAGLLRTKEVATYCRASDDSSRRWSRDKSLSFLRPKKKGGPSWFQSPKINLFEVSHLFLVNKKTTNYMKFQIPRCFRPTKKNRRSNQPWGQRCNRTILHRPLKIHDVEGANQQGDEVPHGPVDMECPWHLRISLPLTEGFLGCVEARIPTKPLWPTIFFPQEPALCKIGRVSLDPQQTSRGAPW